MCRTTSASLGSVPDLTRHSLVIATLQWILLVLSMALLALSTCIGGSLKVNFEKHFVATGKHLQLRTCTH